MSEQPAPIYKSWWWKASPAVLVAKAVLIWRAVCYVVATLIRGERQD